MQWRNALAAGAFAALPLFAQQLVRLPAPSLPKDTAVADSASRAQADTSGDTVGYSAVRIRFHGDHFSLSDKALLKYKGSTLRADSIVYFSGDDIVEAMGAPLIEDPINPPILGYRMRYNLNNRVGTIYYGSSKRDKQYFNGTEIRRQPEGDVYIARGEFSTCDKPDPDYFFYARRMIVEPNAKVLSGPVVMNIAEVPVAILPMAVVPLGKGRRSGLVQPKIGGDQSQGFYLQNLGYYWAISDYMDLLTTGDVFEGQSGTFDNTDFNVKYQWYKRYVWNGSINNQLKIPQFDPNHSGDILDFTNDLKITPDERQTLVGSGTLQFNPSIIAQSTLTPEDVIQSQQANANLGYRRQFDNQAILTVGLAQNYNITQDLVQRDLPNVTFQAGGPLIPAPEDQTPGAEDPWYRKLRWDYGNVFNVDQVSYPSLTGSRGDTNVYVGYSDHLSFSGQYPAGYVNLSPSVNLTQLWSLSHRTGDSARPYRTDFNPSAGHTGEYFFGWNTRVDAGTHLYATAQADDHPWFGRITAMRHTISPNVSLTYAPELDSNPAYYPNPKIGGTAYQAEQRAVGFQLSNDLSLKFADPADPKKKPELYTLLTTNSSASYNFANHTRPFSDIPSSFNLYLTRNIALTLSTDHVLYDDLADSLQLNQLTSPILRSWSFGWRKGIELDGSFSTGARWRDAQGMAGDRFDQSPWSVSLNYGFAFNGERKGTSQGSAAERLIGSSETYQVTKTHQATGSLHLNPTAEWKMSYDTEFNFTEGRFSSHVFGFERTLHCWQMEFHWTPVGVGEGWNFQIRIIDLPDIKLQTSDTRVQRGS